MNSKNVQVTHREPEKKNNETKENKQKAKFKMED